MNRDNELFTNFSRSEMLLIETKYDVDFAMVSKEVFDFRKVVVENLKSYLFSFVQKFVPVLDAKDHLRLNT